MDAFFSLVPIEYLFFAALITFCAGTVKGMVGFSMPTIMMSGLSVFLSPEVALAGLILPTLFSNGLQAFRYGWREVWGSVQRFRVFLAVGLVFLLTSAQLVRALPADVLFLLIGATIIGFAVLQLSGWSTQLPRASAKIEAAVGAFTGAVGGVSGIWGPPTVAYLTAIGTAKADQMRIQGVIYGLGAVALFAAHVQSGVLRAETLPLSVAMVPVALLGMAVGLRWQDRVNQATFRRVTLIILLLGGANLVRRGLVG